MTERAFNRPADVAAEIGCSERALRKLARDIGACRIIGKTMVLLDEDVAHLKEAINPERARAEAAEARAVNWRNSLVFRTGLETLLRTPHHKRLSCSPPSPASASGWGCGDGCPRPSPLHGNDRLCSWPRCRRSLDR